MILKYYIGSTKGSKQEAQAAHQTVIKGWKDAIRAAEVAQESWPLHVTGKLYFLVMTTFWSFEL